MSDKQPKSLWPDWGTTEDGRQYAPAAQRNKDFVLAELKNHMPKHGTVLEIASGTGEQAVYFTPQLPNISWLPSDYEDNKLVSITAWLKHQPCARVLPPIKIDTSANTWVCEEADFKTKIEPISAIVCINMIHIAPWAAGLGLLAGAGRILQSGGVLFFYGPFMKGGEHTAPSNLAFDQRLKERDASWGLRDIDDVEKVANSHGLILINTIEMPANNFVLVFEKQ